MFFSEGLSVNEKGHLTIGGCDCVDLAENFGTPLYVMDEATIRANCRRYKKAIAQHFGGRGQACYASKAFSCLEMCRIIDEEGLGLDVVSEGELYTALKAGVRAEKIHFHGNNKTPAELKFALSAGVGRIVVDNFHELRLLNEIAENLGVRCKISLRIKPGIDAHTHDFIKTGQIDSKFGFALGTGEATRAVQTASTCKNLELVELHCHIGSQIFERAPFALAAETMIAFMAEIRESLRITIRELNLGGGFGIRYVEKDKPLPCEEYVRCICEAIEKTAHARDFPVPFLYIEPGRSIVGEAGITLYRVGGVKDIPGVRTYVSLDGGMCDNPRYALYGAAYTCLVANKANIAPKSVVTLAGKCCESGDLIQENTLLQEPEVGDIVAVLSTGAYNYSMASNYNRILKPAVVMVQNSQARVIVKRETLDDLIRNDVFVAGEE